MPFLAWEASAMILIARIALAATGSRPLGQLGLLGEYLERGENHRVIGVEPRPPAGEGPNTCASVTIMRA